MRATLALRPIRKSAAAPLVLDGDGLSLTSLRIDGVDAAADSLHRDAGRPHHRPAAATAVHARDRDAGRSLRQYPAHGPLSLERHLLHAMRGGRLSPHHLFPRPARRDGGLHDAHRGRQSAKRRCCSPTAISVDSGELPDGRHFAVWHDPIPSRPISSRWSAAISARVEDNFRTMSGREVALRIYVEHGKEERCGYAMDALKRAMRWDEEAFGREYDLDIFMIVAVSDFNMGAMENKGLNIFNDKYVLASPRDRDRRRLREHRGGDRPRIFPQLDRQPHHLPRLVPALPQGRPDRLPRPGILRRHALAAGQAHRRRARAARRAVPRGRRPARPSGAAGDLSRDQQLLHGDRLREGRRGRPHAADPDRPGAFRAGMDLYFARHDGEAATVEDFIAVLRRRQRRAT